MYSFRDLIKYSVLQPKTKFPPDPVAEIWYRVKFERFQAKKLNERLMRKSRDEIINESIKRIEERKSIEQKENGINKYSN